MIPGSLPHPPAGRDEVIHLRREVALLRESLWEQWESNHVEHCSRDWRTGQGLDVTGRCPTLSAIRLNRWPCCATSREFPSWGSET